MSDASADTKELLKRAFLEIRSLKAKLAAVQHDVRPGIAIIGIGCRFPGAGTGASSFWNMLVEGRDPICTAPQDRHLGTGPTMGGFLDDIDRFDAAAFEITPREAQAMDPQHRLLLETTWQALADAAIPVPALAGTRTGVFVGLATQDYARRSLIDGITRFYGSGTSPAVAAGRIAYALDLKGPCITVDTACSSSLTAAHLAVKALRSRECDFALVGGVSLMLSGELTESFTEAGMLARDGRCKSFDASADGYGRAEGVGVVILRRLDEATQAGDHVRAVIRGSAINQDGRSAGLTAPNGPAQTAVIQAALADADLSPEVVDFVEAHGSGTPLGDVIEVHALVQVFAGRRRPLRIGAVKSVIGHAEAAAGMAGLIKASLALQHDLVPPNLHFTRLNPEIQPGRLDLEIVSTPRPGVRCVGVSSFGFSGSNAHLVLERAPNPGGQSKAPLPEPSFQRQHFPLPGTGIAIRTMQPDDTMLAGTGGLAHLGVLLQLFDPAERLEDLRFEQPLQVDQPREVRVRSTPAEKLLESRSPLDPQWTTHLGARTALRGGPPLVPSLDPYGRNMSGDQLYRIIEAAGFQFGAEARRLSVVRIGDGRAEGLLAKNMSLADPGVVEAAAQLLYALVPNTERRPPMLSSCAALQRVRPDAPAHSVWIELRPPGADGTIMADLGVRAADGSPVAWLVAARFRRRIGFLERFGHDVVWEKVPAPADTAPTASVVVLGADAGAVHSWQGVSSIDDARVLLSSLPDPVLLYLSSAVEPLPALSQLSAMVRDLASLSCRLVIATVGGVATGRGIEWPANDGSAAVWGMAQAIMAEHPQLGCRLVDLDPSRPVDTQYDLLAVECGHSNEAAVAWRHGCRYARRLARVDLTPVDLPRRAELALPGSPPTITWKPIAAMTSLPDGHVEIEVVAAGLNFRDRMVGLGLRDAQMPLGADLAGIVRRVAEDVIGFSPGDHVVALAEPALADLAVVPARLVAHVPIPDLTACAGMPVAYAVALLGLARGSNARSVFIHQAAGTTGLAAVAVARNAGLTVHATSSVGKHAYLRAIGVNLIGDSRTPKSWGDRGPVDVALGAFGTSIARDVPAKQVVDLAGDEGQGFDLHAFSVDERAACLDQLADYPALPVHAVRRCDLADALTSVGEGIGRQIVMLREPPRMRIDITGAYLVTGAAGAIGNRIARWLSDQGAAEVWMLDRVPAAPAPRCIPVVIDITNQSLMEEQFGRIDRGSYPLRGVFHAAALTGDGALNDLTEDRMASALAAKADGARILDRLTRDRIQKDRRLDHFVLLSSVVSVLPSAGQGAYAAANAILDRLVQERRLLGLPGLSIGLGPVAAGIGDRMGERSHRVWEQHGIGRLNPDDFVKALPELLASPHPHRVILDIDWEAYGQDARADTVAVSRALDLAAVQTMLAPIIGTARPNTLDPDTPLLSLGVDSLMAVEFAQVLGRAAGRSIPRTFIYSYPTLHAVVDALDKVRQPSPVSSTATVGPARESRLVVPVWVQADAADAAADGWRVVGSGDMADELRAGVAGGSNLLDLRPLSASLPTSLTYWQASRRQLLEDFTRELPQQLGTGRRLIWVTRADDPVAELLDGLIAAVRAECPDLRPCRIVLAPGNPDPAHSIFSELSSASDEPLVMLGSGGRMIQRFDQAQVDGRSRPLRHNGTYLVTGGTGGIGRHVTRFLLDTGAGHVVLASRHGEVPADLRQDAGRVSAIRVDLSSETEVTRLLDQLRDRRHPLLGIFHLAGVTADGVVASQRPEAMAPAFGAKSDGAWLLDRGSRNMDLDHFVMFGSLTSIIGLAGTGAYGAANALLHGIARGRQAAGLAGLVIAWGAWAGTGMAASRVAASGERMPTYSSATAIAALGRALTVSRPLVAVVSKASDDAGSLPSKLF